MEELKYPDEFIEALIFDCAKDYDPKKQEEIDIAFGLKEKKE